MKAFSKLQTFFIINQPKMSKKCENKKRITMRNERVIFMNSSYNVTFEDSLTYSINLL